MERDKLQYQKEYNAKNADKVKEYQKAYYEANKDKRIADAIIAKYNIPEERRRELWRTQTAKRVEAKGRIICECGANILLIGLKTHLLSAKHIKLCKKIETDFKKEKIDNIQNTKMTTLPFITELNELFITPKTLRSMKNTSWANYSNKTIYVGYRDCLRIKAKDETELNVIMEKWNFWAKNGMISNIYNNIDGDIIFCNKWDIYDNNITEALKEAKKEERVAREEIERHKNTIKTETIKLNTEIDLNKAHYTPEYIEYEKKTKKEQDERSKQKIKNAEEELPKSIENYDRINERLANQLNYDYIPYKEAEFIEYADILGRTRQRTHILGQKQFEKGILTQLKSRFLQEGEAVYNGIAWKRLDAEKKEWYSDMPSPRQLIYKNGECFIEIQDNLSIQQQIYKKKGVEVVRQFLDTTDLYVAEMFNITKKRMKCWNDQNTEIETDRYIEHKKIQGAFIPYEECGIECFYVRLGYATDGKKLPNFNRGTLECLKYAWKSNIGEPAKAKKQKGIKIPKMPTKKDDLIKELMRL
jgi:hypothetical protein